MRAFVFRKLRIKQKKQAKNELKLPSSKLLNSL